MALTGRKRLRTAFIHPFLYRYPRGIERYTSSLANALARLGVEVHILTWRWANPVSVDTLHPDVDVHIMPTSRYFAAKAVVPFYIWDLLRNAYDFVWIFFATYGEADTLRMMREQRFGIVFHYPYAQVPHRYRDFKQTGLAQRAERIVSVSQFVSDGVFEAFGRPSEIIRHGVDVERFAPNSVQRNHIRQQLGLDQDNYVLLTAAALEERKGIQWVLKALPQVVRRFPQTIYMVLGDDGGYQTELEQMVRELNLNAYVRLLGPRADVTPFYQVADLALILARGEASSLFAMEALACEVPVLAAQQRPFDEIVKPDFGLLVDEASSDQVAQAIINLLSTPSRLRALGSNGRATMMKDYTWERAAEQYIKLLEDTVRSLE